MKTKTKNSAVICMRNHEIYSMKSSPILTLLHQTPLPHKNFKLCTPQEIPTTVGIFHSIQNKLLINTEIHKQLQPDYLIPRTCIYFYLQ